MRQRTQGPEAPELAVSDPLPRASRRRGFEPCRRQNRSSGSILGEKAMRATLEWPHASVVEGAATHAKFPVGSPSPLRGGNKGGGLRACSNLSLPAGRCAREQGSVAGALWLGCRGRISARAIPPPLSPPRKGEGDHISTSVHLQPIAPPHQCRLTHIPPNP
jgi:hypothetical protein